MWVRFGCNIVSTPPVLIPLYRSLLSISDLCLALVTNFGKLNFTTQSLLITRAVVTLLCMFSLNHAPMAKYSPVALALTTAFELPSLPCAHFWRCSVVWMMALREWIWRLNWWVIFRSVMLELALMTIRGEEITWDRQVCLLAWMIE